MLRGHAIECRINAEDASKNFAPAPGRIGDYREPAGPGVRVDSGVGPGSEISPMYDPMVAKLIVWDADREQATARMLRALREYEIARAQDADPVPRGDPRNRAVGQRRDLPGSDRGPQVAQAAGLRAAGRAAAADEPDEEPTVEQTYTVEVSGRRFDVKVIGPPFARWQPPPTASAAAAAAAGRTPAAASAAGAGAARRRRGHARPRRIQGTVLKVAVEAGASGRGGRARRA